MWSVPFNLNLHDTYMGLALIYNQGPFTTSSYWFNKMYYSSQGPHKRGMGGSSITYENPHLVIYGYIESWTYHPLLNISVIPQQRYNLARPVIRKLSANSEETMASVRAAAERATTPTSTTRTMIIGFAQLWFWEWWLRIVEME